MADNPYTKSEQVARERQAAGESRLESIRAAARNPDTQHLIRWLFRRGGLHANPFVTNAEIYRNCGRLELAQELRQLLKTALYDSDRNLYFQLVEGD